MDGLRSFSKRPVKKLSDRCDASREGGTFIIPNRHECPDICFRFALSQFPQERDSLRPSAGISALSLYEFCHRPVLHLISGGTVDFTE